MAAVGGAGSGGGGSTAATAAVTVAAPATAAVAVVDRAAALAAATTEFIQICAFDPAQFALQQSGPGAVAALAPATDHDADPAACCRELLDLFGPDRSWRPSRVSLNARSKQLIDNLLVSLPVYLLPPGMPLRHNNNGVLVYEDLAADIVVKICSCNTLEEGFSLLMEVFLQVNVAAMNVHQSTLAPKVLQLAKYVEPTTGRNKLVIVMRYAGPTLYSLIAKEPQLCTPAFFDEVFAGAEEMLRVRCGGRVCHRDFHAGNITFPFAYSNGRPALSLPCLIDFGRVVLDERFHTNLADDTWISEFDMLTLRASARESLLKIQLKFSSQPPSISATYASLISLLSTSAKHIRDGFALTPGLINYLSRTLGKFSFADSYMVVRVLEATFDETPAGDAARASAFDFVTALKLRYGTTSPYTGFPTFASLEGAAAAAAALAASKPPSAWGADPRKQRGGQRGGQQRTQEQEQEQEPQGRGSLALGLLYLEREKTVGSNNKLQQIILDVAINMLEEKEAMEAMLRNASQEKTTPLSIFNKKKTQTRRRQHRASRRNSRRNRTRRHR
jgi:hypothetical protein